MNLATVVQGLFSNLNKEEHLLNIMLEGKSILNPRLLALFFSLARYFVVLE